MATWCEQTLGHELASEATLSGFRHTFSHFHLDITPLRLSLGPASSGTVAERPNQHWYPLAVALQLGLPAPIRRLLDSLVHG